MIGWSAFYHYFSDETVITPLTCLYVEPTIFADDVSRVYITGMVVRCHTVDITVGAIVVFTTVYLQIKLQSATQMHGCANSRGMYHCMQLFFIQ